MELEEVIERLEKLLKLRLNKANEIKYDNCIIATEDLQIILKYIKEESIPKAVVEEKIKVIQERFKEETRTDFLITLKILENELQEILNKGE